MFAHRSLAGAVKVYEMLAENGRDRSRLSGIVGLLLAVFLCVWCWPARATTSPGPSHEQATAVAARPSLASQELSPAAKRAKLHKILDNAKDAESGIHDACIGLMTVGDAASVPHLIRVLRFFGDAELPLPPGVGIVCTHGHCVSALEQITGAKVGISYSSWKRWWETTHPGQPLDVPPNNRLKLPARGRSVAESGVRTRAAA